MHVMLLVNCCRLLEDSCLFADVQRVPQADCLVMERSLVSSPWRALHQLRSVAKTRMHQQVQLCPGPASGRLLICSAMWAYASKCVIHNDPLTMPIWAISQQQKQQSNAQAHTWASLLPSSRCKDLPVKFDMVGCTWERDALWCAGLAYVPAPKPLLPGHDESFNPPKEFLLSEVASQTSWCQAADHHALARALWPDTAAWQTPVAALQHITSVSELPCCSSTAQPTAMKGRRELAH